MLFGDNIQGEMVLAPSKAESLYITTDIDPETERDKVIWIKDLDIKVEDKDSGKQLVKFMKLNEISKLYKAQLKYRPSPTSNPMHGKETMALTTSNSKAWPGNPGPTLESEASTGS